MGTMEILFMNGVEKLLCVVGDLERYERGINDVVFLTPPQITMFTKHALHNTTRPAIDHFGIMWPELESDLTEFMQDYKDQRAIDRQEIIDCK